MEKTIPTHRFLITKLSLDIISIFENNIEISYPNVLSLSLSLSMKKFCSMIVCVSYVF